MTPMDTNLKSSVPAHGTPWVFLEKGLKKAKEEGKPLTEDQKKKIQELFKQYSELPDAAKAKYANYPLTLAEFKKMGIQKIP